MIKIYFTIVCLNILMWIYLIITSRKKINEVIKDKDENLSKLKSIECDSRLKIFLKLFLITFCPIIHLIFFLYIIFNINYIINITIYSIKKIIEN